MRTDDVLNRKVFHFSHANVPANVGDGEGSMLVAVRCAEHRRR